MPGWLPLDRCSRRPPGLAGCFCWRRWEWACPSLVAPISPGSPPGACRLRLAPDVIRVATRRRPAPCSAAAGGGGLGLRRVADADPDHDSLLALRPVATHGS